MDARLNELEIKLGLMEDLVETLNLTVFRQQEQIDVLARELRSMKQHVSTLPSGEFRSLRDELPPHY